MTDIYNKISELKKQNIRSALCVVVSTSGSTPRKSGSKMLVLEDGKIFGTIGGGTIEFKIISDAIDSIKQNETKFLHYSLDDDLGMHCGGEVDVYIEPLMSLNKLYVFGSGHVGRIFAKFAADVDFDVTVFDNRENVLGGWDLKEVKYVCKDYLNAIEDLTFDEKTYIVIATPNHRFDEQILAVCAKKPSAYIGMMGSAQKVGLTRKRFLEEKILTKEELDRINMPIGMDFPVETPAEIAISILAKIIVVRNKLQKI